MGMLTERDLGQIGKLLDTRFDGFEKKIEKKIEESSDTVVDRVVGAIGEMIEQNVLPQFDGVYDRLDRVEGRLTKVEATMVTKDYLDEKLGSLRGDMAVKHKDFDRRLTALESPS